MGRIFERNRTLFSPSPAANFVSVEEEKIVSVVSPRYFFAFFKGVKCKLLIKFYN